MTRFGAIVIGVFLASVLGFVVAFLLGARSVGNWLGGPAIILSELVAFGHLVTVDDDMPGGWSNPGGSSALWSKSLVQLAIKCAVFVAVLWLFMTL
jgi:hypothetical protein